MKALAWLCVVLAPMILTLGNLVAREDDRAYELCRRGREAFCLQEGSDASWIGLAISLGLLVFGILILVTRRE
jgi:hypothetical protein